MQDTDTSFIEPLFEAAEAYGKTSLELFKLKLVEQLSIVISTFVASSIVMVFLFLSVMVINIGISIWIGEQLGKIHYGFFCVAGINAIIGGLTFSYFYDTIKSAVSRIIISEMQKNNND